MQASLSFTDKLELFLQRLFDRNVDATSETENYAAKMDTLKLAHSFAGSQMIVVKHFLNTLEHQNIDWVQEAISMYLVGAVDFIGKHERCSIKERMQLIRLILKSNVGVTPEKAIYFFNEALHRQAGSDADAMIRSGAKAAKQWLDSGSVSRTLCLRDQLDNWGILV